MISPHCGDCCSLLIGYLYSHCVDSVHFWLVTYTLIVLIAVHFWLVTYTLIMWICSLMICYLYSHYVDCCSLLIGYLHSHCGDCCSLLIGYLYSNCVVSCSLLIGYLYLHKYNRQHMLITNLKYNTKIWTWIFKHEKLNTNFWKKAFTNLPRMFEHKRCKMNVRLL